MRLNLHTLTKDGTHAGGLDRWKIERAVEKWWVAAKSKKRKTMEGEPPAASWRDAASHLYDGGRETGSAATRASPSGRPRWVRTGGQLQTETPTHCKRGEHRIAWRRPYQRRRR